MSVKFCQVPITTHYPIATAKIHQYASPCVGRGFLLVSYSTSFPYVLLTRSTYTAQSVLYSLYIHIYVHILLTPSCCFTYLLSPFPFSPLSLLFPFPFSCYMFTPFPFLSLCLSLPLSPILTCYMYIYMYLYMYLFCFDVICTWRGLLFFIEPFPLSLSLICTKICTYYIYIYN